MGMDFPLPAFVGTGGVASGFFRGVEASVAEGRGSTFARPRFKGAGSGAG